MSVREEIERVAAFADVQRGEDESIEDGLDLDAGLQIPPDPDTEAYLRAQRPIGAGLEAHLAALPEPTLRKLATVMYVGRDGADGVDALTTHLASTMPTKADVVRTLLEKTPLATYLRDGLVAADAAGIDVEAL